MTVQVLFIGEGPSDEGISIHVERIGIDCGLDIQMTAPDMSLVPLKDRTVSGKISGVLELGGRYDIVFVHRDADRDGREARVGEIADAARGTLDKTPCIPVVPVRMTEAWLILDEQLIRDVAGNPNGRNRLDLPSPREVERLADPKAFLKDVLATASALTGRRRRSFQTSFSSHRRLLLERLDPAGLVSRVPSWIRFVDDTRDAFEALGKAIR